MKNNKMLKFIPHLQRSNGRLTAPLNQDVMQTVVA